MTVLKKVWSFFLRPKYQEYQYPPQLRRKLFLQLLLTNLIIAAGIGMLIGFLQELLQVDTGEHEVAKMMEEYSPLMVAFLAIVMAPLLEESIFRAPLGLFRKSSFFPLALYVSIIGFGFIHIFNFEAYENALWMAPLLILPQLVTGLFLAFVRVRMGFAYGVLFHALFNATLLCPILVVRLLFPEAL